MANSKEQLSISYYMKRFQSRALDFERSHERQSNLRSRIYRLEKSNGELRKGIRLHRESSSRDASSLKSKDEEIAKLEEEQDEITKEFSDFERRCDEATQERLTMNRSLLDAGKESSELVLEALEIDCLWQKAEFALKKFADLVCEKEGSGDDDAEEESAVGVVIDGDDIRPLLKFLDAVEIAFESAEQQMKRMRRDIDVLSGKEEREEEDGFVDVGLLLEVERGLGLKSP